MLSSSIWTEPWTADETIQFITGLASAHASRGGKTGEEIIALLGARDYRSLCAFELDYGAMDAYSAANCRQALAFFKKATFLPLDADKAATALRKFMMAEDRCKSTNEIIRLRDQGLFNFEPWVDAAIRRAQHKIAKVLGKLPRVEDLDYRFSPGATSLTKKRQASVTEKLTAGYSCSEELLPYASAYLEQMPGWVNELAVSEYEKYDEKAGAIDTYWRVPVTITHGRVHFVPKDAQTYRTIIVSGSLNAIAQGAIGRYMFDRCKLNGIDLSDQTINQRLALNGSLTGELATLDLVSASDMISSELVSLLLPWEWWFFLTTLRTGRVSVPGSSDTMILEKFSSMGDGFTFPLQSLIFQALSSSVADDEFEPSVYGDDIIVATSTVSRVIPLLETLGFEVNRKKSFWQGPFRESCGADYFRGIDIRPLYVKETIAASDLFRIHNFYFRKAKAILSRCSPRSSQSDDEFMLHWKEAGFWSSMANLVKDAIHPTLIQYGPDGYGDGHLLGDWTPRRHKKAESHGYGGVLFDTFRLKPMRDKRGGLRGGRVLPVYTVYAAKHTDGVFSDHSIKRFPSSFKAWLESYLQREGAHLRRKLDGDASSVVDRDGLEGFATDQLPLERDAKGRWVKTTSLPGTQGYVKVSIYIFDPTVR